MGMVKTYWLRYRCWKKQYLAHLPKTNAVLQMRQLWAHKSTLLKGTGVWKLWNRSTRWMFDPSRLRELQRRTQRVFSRMSCVPIWRTCHNNKSRPQLHIQGSLANALSSHRYHNSLASNTTILTHLHLSVNLRRHKLNTHQPIWIALSLHLLFRPQT